MATQAVVGIQLNEEKLIRAGQRGDEQAVEALFRRYHRPLFRRLCGCWGTRKTRKTPCRTGCSRRIAT